MFDGRGGRGDHGEDIGGPPWILGHRGVPREAPENTLAGLRRAIELGLDGFEYDLRACATGESVLLHDATLDRTTDAHGAVSLRALPELFNIDAGSWFNRFHRGEPVPLFDEALEICGSAQQAWPLHMVELKERGLVPGVATSLKELGPQLSVRVASFLRDVVLDAKDAGLPCMLLASYANEDDRRFVRDERIDAYGVGPRGWQGESAAADWSFCERWAWAVDDARDLLAACRSQVFGFNTNEPYRAMAVRALVKLAPRDEGDYPVLARPLEVTPEALESADRKRGEWFGSWRPRVRVRNPFGWRVRVACGIFLRGGAFEVDGLPVALELESGEEAEVNFSLIGGSRSPGGDPLFVALFRWDGGPGRTEGRLLLDAPLTRVRSIRADPIARRLEMLAERPDQPSASVRLQRSGPHIMLSLENPGELQDPHLIAHLAGETVRGGQGLRLRLPAGFDDLTDGLPFSCGIEGKHQGEFSIRRWAGGLPEGLENGLPGRLLRLGHR